MDLHSRIHIVMQSRTSSTRLPGKSLLSIGGMEIPILAARRAANTGLPVTIVTSVDATDDELARRIECAGIGCLRGPLEDVFARFLMATRDLPPDALIVRLTADNTFPDGRFIELLAHQLVERSCQYIATCSPQDGLPYGMSAEVFTLESLRTAASYPLSDSDKEHVTLKINELYGMQVYQRDKQLANRSHLRCTIDTLEDYLRLCQLFTKVDDPITVSWQNLCELLQEGAGDQKARVPYKENTDGSVVSRLTLGTVQLGVPYGRANTTGQPSPEHASAIIRTALEWGINRLDTARAYGCSESRIGRTLRGEGQSRGRVITKLQPLSDSGIDKYSAYSMVEASVMRSCRELGFDTLDTVLLHDWRDYSVADCHVWNALCDLQQQGVITTLGASVQNPSEARQALMDNNIGALQLPFNLLDYRWDESGIPSLLSDNRSDVTVYARSAFLQGLLLASAQLWPPMAGVDATELCKRRDSLCAELRCPTPLHLCLEFVMAQPWIDSIVVGAETVAQIQQICRAATEVVVTTDHCKRITDVMGKVPLALLDPSQWPQP